MKNIGDIISKTRQNKNMTQEEFASRLGVTPQAVSRWERGNGLPDISLIEGICNVLDIGANELLDIQGANKVIENSDRNMEQEIKNNMFAEPLLLEFGSGLIPCVAEGLETDYLNQCRKALVKETGILIPVLRLRDNIELKENAIRILSYDMVLWEQEIEQNGQTYKVMIDQVQQVCKENYHQIINKQCVKQLIDSLRESYPGVVDGLVPETISYLKLQRRLQQVLKEKGNIRDLIHILEEMEEEIDK